MKSDEKEESEEDEEILQGLVAGLRRPEETTESEEDTNESEAIEATEDTEDTEDIEDLISGRKTAILYCSDEKRIRGIINCLRQLFSAGNRENPQATIGGEKFTSPLFDEISYRDISDLIARYSAHFLSLGLK